MESGVKGLYKRYVDEEGEEGIDDVELNFITAAKNCFAFFFFEGSKDVCEQEQKLNRALDYYRERDEEKSVRIQNLLNQNKQLQEDFREYIYRIGDEFYEQELASRTFLGEIEYNNYTTFFDHQANSLCSQLDLEVPAERK